MRHTIVATAAITAAMGANLLTMPTVASAAEAETCHIWADPPRQVGPGLISGVGHRAGCVQRRDITVRIRVDITRWPDKTVAQSSRSGVINVDLGTQWHCSFGDDGVFFTEILTSAGGKAKSSRVYLMCPNGTDD